MSYSRGRTMYANAGVGTLYAAAGLGAYNTPTPVSVRIVQRGLHADNATPGPGAVDGKWGANTRASLSAWLTTEAGNRRLSASQIRDSFPPDTPHVETITLPEAIVTALTTLSGEYTPTPTRARAPTPTPTTNGGAVTNGNGFQVGNGNGIRLEQWLPWVIGGAALIGVGAFFLLKKPKGGARRTAVARNRRRRRRR